MLAKKLDVLNAFDEGYRIALHADGVADLMKTNGESYGVDLLQGERGVCTCPDFQIRGGSYYGHCKHQWWTGQLSICPECGSIMVLIGDVFECCNEQCGNAKSLGLVREQRRQRQAERQQRA